MSNTNHNFLPRKAGLYALGLLALTALAFGEPIGAIVLAVAIPIFLLVGAMRWTSELDSARAGADIGTAAKCRRNVRRYEAGCLAYLLLVLGALILPGIIGPPHRAPLSISLNNMKQLAIGVMTYAQDYEETFPGWVRNPDGVYAHNTWDEQIDPCVKSKDIYNNLPYVRNGIRSYSQTGTHHRILTYGLNGLLITPPKAPIDGDADFAAVNASHPPQPLSPREVANPAGTILFAEMKTDAPMPGVYGQEPDPKPYTFSGSETSREWRGAWPGWIDISPRAFIEIARGWRSNPYREPYGRNADSGVARDLYGGGGCYAFCDGHVKFMRIGQSLGLGTTTKQGLKITEDNCWSPENTNNMWIPRNRE